MKFTYICEHCRSEVRHRATIDQEKQLIRTLSLSFSCPACRKPVHVQMCDDGSIVSMSGLSHDPSLIEKSNSEFPAREADGPNSTAVNPSVNSVTPSAPPPPLPEMGASTPDQIPSNPFSPPPVTGHVPFASLEESAPKRQFNTGWKFLDNLLNDPPTPMQIVLGIVLLIVAILVFNFDPGANQSGSSDEPSKPTSPSTETGSGESSEDSENSEEPSKSGKTEAGGTDTPNDSDPAAGTNDESPSESTAASTTENERLTEDLPESTDE